MPARKTVIVLGGQPPGHLLLTLSLSGADWVIAADSGILPLLTAGRWPDILTGDFDSYLPGAHLPEECRVVPAPEQDATDFQKALRHLPPPEPGARVIVLGGTGRRSDHFLTNLLITAALDPMLHIRLAADKETLFRVTPDCSYNANVPAKTTISLIPFATCEGVDASGLRWPLQNASMAPGGQLGQSNVALGGRVDVSIRAGCLFVVENHQA